MRRRGQDPELLGDNARRQPGRTGGHKQPEQFKPGFLGQRAQRGDNAFPIHELSQIFMFRRVSNLLTKNAFVKHIS
jgi:hypothetical protein